MDKTTFCDSCKCLRDGEAKYCKECGTKSRPIGRESLPLDEVNCENLTKFLVEVLGYKGASSYEEHSIIAKYETDSESPKGRELLLTPEDVLFIDIEDDHICIFAYLELKKNPSNDIQFFKWLNTLNNINSSVFNFSYVEPGKDDENEEDLKEDENLEISKSVKKNGKLKLLKKIPYIPNLPLIHLYRLCHGKFEKSFVHKMGLSRISPLFAEYLGIIGGSFYAPKNIHRTLL